jgi:hypothetical protein
MTWPQYLRHQCRVDGRLVRLGGKYEHQLLFLLLVNWPRLVVYEEVIEWLWPDPDTQPLGVRLLIYSLVSRLKKRGVRIPNHFGVGLTLLQEPEPAELGDDRRVNLPELGVGDDQLASGDLDASLPR